MVEDQINLELWQKVLDKFAFAIQLPVSTIDMEGNEITIPEKRPFYCQLVRHQRPTLCKECRKKYLQKLKEEKKEIIFYNCICGLLNIMVPIKINNEMIGAVLCESIKQKENNARLCQRVGKMIKILPIELIDAINNMRIINREKIVQYGTLMHILSQSIPTIAHEKKQDEKKISHYKELALIDKLTGLFNRSEFMKRLDREIARLKRFKRPLSVVMIDLDDFKQYNDEYGHQEGDYLLKEAANIFKYSVREIDTVGRYGGEEFILILPETNEENSMNVCERIRRTLEQRKFKRTVTASFGICTSYEITEKEKLIEEADKALYEAKRTGKNKIISKIFR